MTMAVANEILTDITKVYSDALRVGFKDVRPGDWVFDASGGRHKLARVRILKDGTLSIKREDYPFVEHIETPDCTITIVPAHGWTQRGNGYREVPGQPEGPGFKFGEFYETCRCGLVIGSGSDGDAGTASMLLADHANTSNGRGEWY